MPFVRPITLARLLLIGASALLLTGCVTGLANPTGGLPVKRRKDWRNVAIVTAKLPGRYVVLGTVSVFGDEFVKEPSMEDQLRRQAAALGADAVLVESASHPYDSGSNSGRFNSGLAIKYTSGKTHASPRKDGRGDRI